MIILITGASHTGKTLLSKAAIFRLTGARVLMKAIYLKLYLSVLR